jgi:hypothetical protein
MGRATARIFGRLVLAGLLTGTAVPAIAQNSDRDPEVRRPPRITIYPRTMHPGPNAKRYCRSWLAKEYRVSGPVIVPRMQCWWQ